MLCCDAAGYVLLAAGSATRLAPLTVLGAVVTYGAGWGWNGVFNMAVSVNHPAAPAKASGITLTGNRIAGIVGPFLFALVVTHASYSVAWLAAGAAALAAATTMFLGDRMLSAGQARAGVAYAEMRTVDDVARHPQLAARRRWSQAATANGVVPLLVPPITWDDEAVSQLPPVPSLGEHNEALRAEFAD